jgi:uncharacterized protein YcfJ
MPKLSSVILIAAFLLSGCATATPAQKGAGLGALIGAGAGTIIGHQKDKELEGALIGGAAGAAAGALIGDATATKFCPTCGASYDASLKYCPKDGTELKFKQQ